ncbi:hypothetical protein H4Q26_002676 [Puccinia striiformis f. sp. tritici PST-130]|uniref:Uncharacterized protein n=1 Tax=Puccinia striiformis f. sp. tritici PST-78 TaxID=1165861 RepID=A0A0L0UZ47_9BASI|nr:hypothetical protein H4Q26_002676 [Puccinia striiformis f. sp. tritici PST-130]KNE92323.1 hypothetical protein PSTG_14281 [Puccinia striiformis f. sp. tritici PST-78]
MSARQSVSTTQLPQVNDPETIIRKANTAKRLAAKALVTQSQLLTTSSTTLATTREEPSPTHPKNLTLNPLLIPTTTTLTPLTPTNNPPPTINPTSSPLAIDNLPSPFLTLGRVGMRPHSSGPSGLSE